MASLCGMPTIQYSAQSARLSVWLSGRVQRWQVVKVIWHKAHHRRRPMVECYLTVTATYPPMRAQWRHLANTFELVHPSAHSSPQLKWQIDRLSGFCTAHSTAESAYNLQQVPLSTRIAPSNVGSWPHITHDALGPCEPTTQTAPRSVQPCLYRQPWSVPILYNGLPVFPFKLPLPMLAPGPHVIRGSLGPPESGIQMETWSFQPFLQGSLVW